MTILENPNIRIFRGVEYDLTDPKFLGLSKQKIKRLLKDERWNENQEEIKAAFREKEKIKSKQRKEARRALGECPPTKRKLAALSEQTPVNLVIDCGFNSLMAEKELVSFVKQLSISYGRNRTAPKSTHFHLTSVDDIIKTALDQKCPSWEKWKQACTTDKSYLDLFEKKDLIYLTADSENVLEELEPGKAYIIGGIVDKNRYKNLCQQKAVEQGIITAKLPINHYLNLSTRKVLTVNQVIGILLTWLHLKDWEKAILATLPGRKLKV